MIASNLIGRTAKCTDCDRFEPSNENLPFFKRGGNSKTSPFFHTWHRTWEEHHRWYEANLGYPAYRFKTPSELADLEAQDRARQIEIENLLNKVQETATGDSFYCGCNGWD